MTKITEALALYRSMVRSGEQETPTSEAVYEAAVQDDLTANAQVDSMLDHIAPQSRLDDLNGKLTQVSNWLAGSAPEHHEMRAELEETINRHCAENGSDTPDFILAEYLTGCLSVYDRALKAREQWYGRKLTMEQDGAVAGYTPTPEPTEEPQRDQTPADFPDGGPA